MSGHIDITEKCQKEDSFQINSSDESTKLFYADEEHATDDERKNNNICNILKRYSRFDLLSLRNGQLSIHYPHCALRPELQALSIWTCRLRCELHYLGLWKIKNTGNSHGNCSCNGSCSSYTCSENSGHSYASSSYVSSQQLQQQSQHSPSSSPTLGSKRSVRSRERSLNYQRCINADLIRGTSPAGSGKQLTQHNLSHARASFMDHRSISSSHLMPAFAKRRMGHTNPIHNHIEVCSNFNNVGGHHSENFSNDCSENASHYDTALKSRKELMKNSNNQNDLHLYKTSSNSRPDKNSQYPDCKTGWMMNLVKQINTEFSPSNCKSSNSPLSGGNKKLVYERRIGSGRLVPRDVNWEIRGGKKQNEKDNNNASQNSTNNNIDKDITTSNEDELNNRNSFSKRFLDGQERRFFDRRIISSDDSGSSIGSSSKRYSAAALGEERNNFESNYHQQENFTGQRSMSFRRREYVDHRDHRRDFREFRVTKESRESRDNRESKVVEHHHNKDEPEWFSEGPTSQHDTIELRGFEDSDESHQQMSIRKYAKMERKPSESSLLSNNSSCNINLSTKEDVDISGETANNSFNNTAKNDLNKENDNNNVNIDEANEDALKLSSDIADTKTSTEQSHSLPGELSDEKIHRSNATELFFDNFLNIEALENSLIANVNDQTMSNNDLGNGGKSRFSRWFFNKSNNQNDNDECNNNPPTKDDRQRFSKDLNESEFNSFMTFLKCNNIPTPELPKSLPSNVSALSVEELEASMRKMDAAEKTAETDESDIQSEISQNERTFPQSVGINTQDVEAFRKLLDQLLKPRVDISMNIILPNTSEHPLPLTNSDNVISPDMTPLPHSSTISLSAMSKQEYVMKVMHQQYIQQQQPQQPHLLHHQQNIRKMVVPHVHHQRMTLMSPYQQTSDNLSLISAPPHHQHHMSMILNQSQKRLDVQHLIQSVVREDLSRSFLEKELKNPNIPPYTKDIISTVLKETSRLNAPSGTQTNLSTSETTAPANENITAPNNLMQSLARGEVSLNHLELELNRLSNIGIINEVPSSIGTLKERSRCSTLLQIVSTTTNAGAITPLPTSQVVSTQQQQQQNSIITNENIDPLLSEQQQAISSIIRQQHHDNDPSMHIPTQREWQMHTQAIMQTAIFKKKIEVEHEQRRRQEMHKQHELESSNSQHQQQSNFAMTQQVHEQPSRHVNSPTPLAFTPTSVLRKMTAEKDTTSPTTAISSISPQQIQQHIQQPNLKLKQLQQHQNQPRMILGGGGLQYMHQQQHHILPTANVSPQISPQQKPQIRNQPAVPSKWPLITHSSMDSNHSLLSNMNNKPIGRPILKGPGPIVAQNTNNPRCQNQLSLYQNSQSMQQINQMQKYPSIHYQQQQPSRQIVGQQFSSHMLQHQMYSSQQNNMHNQQLLRQRSVVMQRHQIQQNDLGNHASLPPSTSHSVNNDNNSAINLNYQRDGGLSPTSNQLAQWFSPELLAQASAGKLPLLNMNQALSLEEFERNIQHSSNAVHN